MEMRSVRTKVLILVVLLGAWVLIFFVLRRCDQKAAA